ncbi:MAG: anaerobic glycerol-3-phosphate dehydrogenase subunit C [Thermoguttaceae bacterium]
MHELDHQRERIQEDLRGLISGDVRCDDLFCQLFSSDGSIYEIRPLGVVRPRSTADVAACVQYAAEKRISLHARGAGSGMAGESLGPGLVVDFSKYLRRIIRIETESVRVQPGIVHERLNAHLRPRGRIFGPDPANTAVTTMGSMIAIDASGSRWLKYGSVRRHVESLQVVMADGQAMEFGREPIVAGASIDSNPRKRELINRLSAILAASTDVIRSQQPKSPLNRCGYNLADVVSENSIDLAGVMVGSEGTLGLITEATLATQAIPRHRGVVLLLYESLDKAARSVPLILPWHPAACDLMDRRHLSLVRESEVRFDLLIPAEAEAALLVEFEGDEPQEMRDQMRGLIDGVQQQARLAFGSRQAFDQEETELFLNLPNRAMPLLYRLKGPSRPVPVVEDVSVPPDILPDFLVRTQNVLKRRQVTASLLCHAGHGQLHIQPFLDLDDPNDVQRMRLMAEDLYEEVFSVGGTIGGEHAYGLSRTQFLQRQAGPLYEVLRQVKQIFDPENVLNPWKIISDDPELMTRNLRPPLRQLPMEGDLPVDEPEKPALRDLVELQVNWDPQRVADATASCNRCGECRSQSPQVRMCPIFRFLPTEEASPRAKANLIRGILNRSIDLSRLSTDAFKDVADLCVHCHSCRLECPAGVDIPKLMMEAKAAYLRTNGMRFADWIMTRLDLAASIGRLLAPLTNWTLGNRQMRWVIEKTLGIAQGRKLPRVAARPFLRLAARRRLTRQNRRSTQRILYFVDTFANFHDPQLGEALVSVLKHNGIGVYVPADQWSSGMASIASGALDQARKIAKHNIALLAETVRQGYHIIATEPAAVLCLTHEYLHLIDDEDSRLVAAHTSEACSYLWKMHLTGKLQLDFKPVHASLGYHTPCHLRALNVGTPGENLLGLVPGLRLHHIEQGCSGMAGTFGMLHRNYRSSLRAGWGLISKLRNPAIQAGTTECSSCRIQMEQGTTKRTIHPIKLLALAYGLMPDVASLLTTPGEELIIS